MNTQHFIHDIPRDIAYRANLGTSFVPEQRGETERNEYASTLATDFEMLLKHAPTDEKRAILETEFARYREGRVCQPRHHIQRNAFASSGVL